MVFSEFKKWSSFLVLMVFALGWMGGCSAAKRFDDPDDAMDSLVAALRNNDHAKLEQILGSDGKDLLSSGDEINDQENIKIFLTAYDQAHKLVPLDDRTLSLEVGFDNWPMPIPLVKDDFWNNWRFDTDAGRDEIISRRIGRNELNTIQTCLAIVDAQREYAQADPEHVGLPVYAQRFFSDPGKKNGLYWETKEGEPQSPLGPLAADAEEEGYRVPNPSSDKGPHPYHGYYFRILKGQGPSAPGGVRDYMAGDHMLGGFAVVAYPANYGVSGIMTFIINQDGKLYQRDLGEDTVKVATRVDSYDPDSYWTKVPDTDQVISQK